MTFPNIFQMRAAQRVGIAKFRYVFVEFHTTIEVCLAKGDMINDTGNNLLGTATQFTTPPNYEATSKMSRKELQCIFRMRLSS